MLGQHRAEERRLSFLVSVSVIEIGDAVEELVGEATVTAKMASACEYMPLVKGRQAPEMADELRTALQRPY